MDSRKQAKLDRDAEHRAAPPGTVVYKAILKEGRDELQRPSSGLFWSGIAAGLSMGFSLVTEALLRSQLPVAEWAPLVSKLGYSIGFLIVILARQQLFTENTLTPVLPLLIDKTGATALNVLRLWSIVLAANLLGAVAMAWTLTGTSILDAAARSAVVQIGHEAMAHPFGSIVLRGIFAGWLIAMMVWLLPFAETGRVWVIIIITYVVGLGHFSHVVAGSVVAFALAAAGEKPWLTTLWAFALPALIGNIIGGCLLVAAVNHAQVVSGEVADEGQ